MPVKGYCLNPCLARTWSWLLETGGRALWLEFRRSSRLSSIQYPASSTQDHAGRAELSAASSARWSRKASDARYSLISRSIIAVRRP